MPLLTEVRCFYNVLSVPFHAVRRKPKEKRLSYILCHILRVIHKIWHFVIYIWNPARSTDILTALAVTAGLRV